MKPFNLIGILLVGVLAACNMQPQEEPVSGLQAGDWEGHYYHGGVHRSGESFDLKKGGDFIFVHRSILGFPEEKVGKWFETKNMIYLEPEGKWESVEPFRFLKKIVENRDRYLLPSGHSEFLYDQMGDLLAFSFFRGSSERRKELEELRFYESLIQAGVTHEELVQDGFFDK